MSAMIPRAKLAPRSDAGSPAPVAYPAYDILPIALSNNPMAKTVTRSAEPNPVSKIAVTPNASTIIPSMMLTTLPPVASIFDVAPRTRRARPKMTNATPRMILSRLIATSGLKMR